MTLHMASMSVSWTSDLFMATLGGAGRRESEGRSEEKEEKKD